tara:strand:- start:48629 stop:49996 length:1368 start_codon:yes stop_codon:yes gene_type:complete
MGLNKGQEEATRVLTEWYNDKTSGKELATLEGWAGTGKTYMTKEFITSLNLSRVLVSAPTNRAKGVIEKSSGFAGKTVHSVLGLQLDLDLSDFNPMNPVFNPKRPPDVNYQLIVIDEASMINKNLYQRLKELAAEKKVKMLFMGDRFQLPPVKERISKVFTDCEYKAVLTEIVRQGKGNPNTKLIELCIKDIQERTDNVDGFIMRESQNITPMGLADSKGFIYTPTSSFNSVDFLKADRDNLYNNSSKYLAYTNDNISKAINGIRKNVFHIEDFITIGESLVGYRGISIKRGKVLDTVIVNSEDYVVKDIIKSVLQEGMDGYQILIENFYTKHTKYVNVIDTSNEHTAQTYLEIVRNLYVTAKKFGRQYWVKYYNFVNNNLAMIDVKMFIAGKDERIKQKDILYNYGITIHKSQGGTFTNSFVNLSNINRCYDNEDRRRLKYVALSRCTNVNIII